jgi:hypothetical protein
MRRPFWLSVVLPLIMGFVGTILAQTLAMPALVDAQQASGIEGSWSLITSWPDGRQTLGLATYNSNGTLVFSTSNPRLSAGHGTWVSTGNREFTTTWVALRFDPAGAVIGTQRARGQLTLAESPDAFTTQGHIELLDREGNVVSSDTNTSQGRRVRAEPMP